MMEIDLALLADAATIDAAGKLNILGVFDRISVQALPAQHPHLSLVLRFLSSVKEAGTHQVRIVLSDPGGEEVARMEGEIHIPPGSPAAGGQIRVPHILNLDRLLLPKAGRFAFDISVDDEHKVSLPLYVHEARGGGGRVAQA